jgi:hypothetical protein
MKVKVLLLLLSCIGIASACWAASGGEVFNWESYDMAIDHPIIRKAAQCEALEVTFVGTKSAEYGLNSLVRLSIERDNDNETHQGIEYLIAFQAVKSYYLGGLHMMKATNNAMNTEARLTLMQRLDCSKYKELPAEK